MSLRRLTLLWAVLELSMIWSVVGAQQAPPVTPNAPPTPPIAPKTQPSVVPPDITISPPRLPSDVPNRPLTADEAARIALRLQPDVAVARAEITAAQGRTGQVRSGLLPNLNVNASYNNVTTLSGQGSASAGTTTGTGGTGSETGGGTSDGPTVVTPLGASGSGQSSGLAASATLRQLIFDFNHTRDLVRQSGALERAATYNLSRVQSDLVQQVKAAFYQVMQNQQLVGVNEANVRNRQAQRDLAVARLNSGLGLPSDVATAETALSEAISNLIVARNNASLARVNLALLLGVDPRTPIQTAETEEAPIPGDNVDSLVNSALRMRPEILQAQATVQANQYGVSAAKTTNAPVLSGSLGVTTRGSDFPPRNDTLVIGASITFSPFDGGLTSGRVKEARANLDIARSQLRNTQIMVTSDVAQAYFNLRSAEQRVVSANTEAANAAEGVRIAEGRYRTGLGLFLDIINAQAQLLTAQTNQANALGAVNQARAALNRAIGAALR